jgi:parallel beta-helix repeat protein
MRRLLGMASIAALLAVTVLVLSAAQALGHHVKCGDVVTQDTTLDGDLLSCPGNGIVIGADNVTLDLNGHTIEGGTSFFGVGAFSNGHSGVTIENGVIRKFGVGVQVARATNNRVRRLSVADSGSWGILQLESSGNLISQNSLIDNGHNSFSLVTGGIGLGVGSHNEIRENRLSDNVQYGISLSGDDNAVGHNAVSGSAYGISLGGDGNRAYRNSVSSSGFPISLRDARENQIEQNRLRDNAFGIQLEYSDDNQIVGNSVRNSASFGVHVVTSNRNLVGKNAVSSDTAADGIGVSGQDNRIVDNRVASKNGIGIGLYTYDRRSLVENNFVSARDGIYLGSPAESTITGNVVSNSNNGVLVHGASRAAVLNNRVRNAVSDGILVAEQSTEILVEGNTARRSGDDGIDVESADTTLATNKASRNADLGIEAVEGVLDGGGNRAFGNGNPLQCLNVACK